MPPFAIPVTPMLCRLADQLPSRGEWIYEPKWDGFRGLLSRDLKRVRIHSRNLKDMTSWFPDVISNAASFPECVLDGELVAMRDDRQDFELLHGALAGQSVPVAFVAFDVLSIGNEDLRHKHFRERRESLEELALDHPELQITPQTDDIAVAETWLTDLLSFGFEGVVAKRLDEAYLSGRRAMIKVKQVETADLVVGGYTGVSGEPKALLVGAYDEAGLLHNVGATSLLPGSIRNELSRIKPLEERSTFTGRGPEFHRWQSNGSGEWTAIEPRLVAEVAFNRIDSGRFRHAARFLRWRPDKDPKECLLDPLISRSRAE